MSGTTPMPGAARASLRAVLEAFAHRSLVVRPSTGAAPTADEVCGVEIDRGGTAIVRAAMPGLYGLLAIGPPGIERELCDRDEDESALLRGVLDALHDLLSAPLVRRLLGARLAAGLDRGGGATDAFVARLSGREAGHLESARLRRLVGTAACPTPSLADLQTALGVACPDLRPKVAVLPPRRILVAETDRSRLDGRARLGRACTLGRRAWAAGIGVCVAVTAGDASTAFAILPGGATHESLRGAVEHCVPRHLRVELEVRIASTARSSAASVPGDGATLSRSVAAPLGLGARLHRRSADALSVRVPLRRTEEGERSPRAGTSLGKEPS